jgi:hypothetical protein
VRLGSSLHLKLSLTRSALATRREIQRLDGPAILDMKWSASRVISNKAVLSDVGREQVEKTAE